MRWVVAAAEAERPAEGEELVRYFDREPAEGVDPELVESGVAAVAASAPGLGSVAVAGKKAQVKEKLKVRPIHPPEPHTSFYRFVAG